MGAGIVHGVLEHVAAAYAGTGIVIMRRLDHQLVEVLDDVLELCCRAVSPAAPANTRSTRMGTEGDVPSRTV